MDYSSIPAIIAGVVIAGFGLKLFLRRSVHVRGMEITYPGGRAKIDELIVSADRDRSEERQAFEGKVVEADPGAGAGKLPPSEKPVSIETKLEDPGELAA